MYFIRSWKSKTDICHAAWKYGKYLWWAGSEGCYSIIWIHRYKSRAKHLLSDWNAKALLIPCFVRLDVANEWNAVTEGRDRRRLKVHESTCRTDSRVSMSYLVLANCYSYLLSNNPFGNQRAHHGFKWNAIKSDYLTAYYYCRHITLHSVSGVLFYYLEICSRFCGWCHTNIQRFPSLKSSPENRKWCKRLKYILRRKSANGR